MTTPSGRKVSQEESSGEYENGRKNQICAPRKNHGQSGVILEGQTPALNIKQTKKKVNIVFGRMGWTLPSQTKNLIHKYIILSWPTMFTLSMEKWRKCFSPLNIARIKNC
jgi:hypothetical protein